MKVVTRDALRLKLLKYRRKDKEIFYDIQNIYRLLYEQGNDRLTCENLTAKKIPSCSLDHHSIVTIKNIVRLNGSSASLASVSLSEESALKTFALPLKKKLTVRPVKLLKPTAQLSGAELHPSR